MKIAQRFSAGLNDVFRIQARRDERNRYSHGPMSRSDAEERRGYTGQLMFNRFLTACLAFKLHQNHVQRFVANILRGVGQRIAI